MIIMKPWTYVVNLCFIDFTESECFTVIYYDYQSVCHLPNSMTVIAATDFATVATLPPVATACSLQLARSNWCAVTCSTRAPTFVSCELLSWTCTQCTFWGILACHASQYADCHSSFASHNRLWLQWSSSTTFSQHSLSLPDHHDSRTAINFEVAPHASCYSLNQYQR